jgi:hypothetical protein
VPVKHIEEIKSQVTRFSDTPAHDDILGFITNLNRSVRGMPVSQAPPPSPIVQSIVGVLDTLSSWIDQIPPLPNAQRFGNKAFRTWLDRLTHHVHFAF